MHGNDEDDEALRRGDGRDADVRDGTAIAPGTGMREWLTEVREGMAVYDRANDMIGTVRDVYLGSEPGASTASLPETAPHSFIDDLAQALASPGLPEVVRERLRHEGFIRINVSGPFASDRYAFASQIRGVSKDGVTLDVIGDDLPRP